MLATRILAALSCAGVLLGHAAPQPPNDPAALALLDRAAAAQGDPGFDLPVRDYRLEGEMTTYGPQGRIIFDFRLVYANPSRLWSRFEEEAFSRWTISGFDGTTAWLQDGKGVVPLVGREFRRDREELRSRLVLARTLVDCFVLQSARTRGTQWTLEGVDQVSAVIALERDEREALQRTLGAPRAADPEQPQSSSHETPPAAGEAGRDSSAASQPAPREDSSATSQPARPEDPPATSQPTRPEDPSAAPQPVTLRLRFAADTLRLSEARLRIPSGRDHGEAVDQTTVFGKRQLDTGGGFLIPADLTVRDASGERLFRVRLRKVAFNQGVSENLFRVPR